VGAAGSGVLLGGSSACTVHIIKIFNIVDIFDMYMHHLFRPTHAAVDFLRKSHEMEGVDAYRSCWIATDPGTAVFCGPGFVLANQQHTARQGTTPYLSLARKQI
jgi:hypothetical protein